MTVAPALTDLPSGVLTVSVKDNQGNITRIERTFKIQSATSTPGEPPVISAVYPTSGPSVGGTRIQILGRNFQPGAIVRLGGVPLTAVIFKNAAEMTGVTAPLAAGAYSLEVVQSEGTTLLANAFTYRQLAKVTPRAPGGSQRPALRIPFVIDSQESRTNLGINNLGVQPRLCRSLWSMATVCSSQKRLPPFRRSGCCKSTTLPVFWNRRRR